MHQKDASVWIEPCVHMHTQWIRFKWDSQKFAFNSIAQSVIKICKEPIEKLIFFSEETTLPEIC